MRASDHPVAVRVEIDGDPVPRGMRGADLQDTHVLVDEPRMYNLVKTREYDSHVLRLYAEEPGLEVYAFTFGSCVVP